MIKKEMKIMDIIRQDRRAVAVLSSYGMGCIHCLAADDETLEEAAMVHGLDATELENALNNACK
ncbi:MAG: DUF1858 domain-containing protein [Clostridia bacterium]